LTSFFLLHAFYLAFIEVKFWHLKYLEPETVVIPEQGYALDSTNHNM